MNTIWFLILVAMVAVYAVLDGFDLGVGTVLLFLTRTRQEREAALKAIGPVWNGNEVWLLSAGGAMVAAFPGLYAAGFSGFYLPLIIVLWLFVGRGIGYEFRHFEDNDLWRGAAEVSFSVASLLLALFFGVAVGNVLRGVPMNADGQFTGALFFLLNPFALVAGLLTVSTLALHGSAFLSMRSDGELKARALKFAKVLWALSALLTIVIVAASFFVRPDFTHNYASWPWLLILPLAAVASLVAIPIAIGHADGRAVFGATVALVVTVLGSAAAGLYPRMLPAMYGSSQYDRTIYNSAAGHHSLVTALIANVIGMSIVTFYMIFIYRRLRIFEPVSAMD